MKEEIVHERLWTATNGRTIAYVDFLASWPEGAHAEWVDGKVIPMVPPSSRHQDLVTFLSAILRYFAESKGLGHVLVAPFQMKGPANMPGREPDILFIAGENLTRLKLNFLDGPADLAVEIVSPESRRRDRQEKLIEYQRVGVREYWIIDPVRQEATFYHLGEDTLYHPMRMDRSGFVQSMELPGLKIKVGWLWLEPLPSLPKVFKELKFI